METEDRMLFLTNSESPYFVKVSATPSIEATARFFKLAKHFLLFNDKRKRFTTTMFNEKVNGILFLHEGKKWFVSDGFMGSINENDQVDFFMPFTYFVPEETQNKLRGEEY